MTKHSASITAEQTDLHGQSAQKKASARRKQYTSPGPAVQDSRLSETDTLRVTGGYSNPLWVYTVRTGDNLYDLAQKYGTTVATLCEINKVLPSDQPLPGTKLYIPYR